jgi:hypothetical protein
LHTPLNWQAADHVLDLPYGYVYYFLCPVSAVCYIMRKVYQHTTSCGLQLYYGSVVFLTFFFFSVHPREFIADVEPLAVLHDLGSQEDRFPMKGDIVVDFFWSCTSIAMPSEEVLLFLLHL